MFTGGLRTSLLTHLAYLSTADERYLMQELLHLAESEPGENILDCEFNSIPFDIPHTWVCAKVPHQGIICFIYARCNASNLKSLALGSTDGKPLRGHAPRPSQFPPKFSLPCLPDTCSLVSLAIKCCSCPPISMGFTGCLVCVVNRLLRIRLSAVLVFCCIHLPSPPSLLQLSCAHDLQTQLIVTHL